MRWRAGGLAKVSCSNQACVTNEEIKPRLRTTRGRFGQEFVLCGGKRDQTNGSCLQGSAPAAIWPQPGCAPGSVRASVASQYQAAEPAAPSLVIARGLTRLMEDCRAGLHVSEMLFENVNKGAVGAVTAAVRFLHYAQLLPGSRLWHPFWAKILGLLCLCKAPADSDHLFYLGILFLCLFLSRSSCVCVFVLFFLLHCNHCLQIHAASLEVVSSLSSFERLIDGSKAVHDVHKTLTELSRSGNKTEQNAANAPEIKQIRGVQEGRKRLQIWVEFITWGTQSLLLAEVQQPHAALGQEPPALFGALPWGKAGQRNWPPKLLLLGARGCPRAYHSPRRAAVPLHTKSKAFAIC